MCILTTWPGRVPLRLIQAIKSMRFEGRRGIRGNDSFKFKLSHLLAICTAWFCGCPQTLINL